MTIKEMMERDERILKWFNEYLDRQPTNCRVDAEEVCRYWHNYIELNCLENYVPYRQFVDLVSEAVKEFNFYRVQEEE